MKSLRLFGIALMFLMFAGSAFAWNCSDPLAARVDVGTTKPSGSAGDGDGQYFLGTGSEGTKGHYYVCEVPKNKTKGGGGNPVCQGGKNTCSPSSTSTSGSSSSSSATGGNSSSTATGGTATSSSGVNNSGNSSNTNNNTAQGGAGGSASQGQKQGQGQTQSSSSDNSGGNSSNSYSSNTNVEASKIPVNTAFAPTQIPTVSCFKGFGAGVQTMPVGASFGGGKIDENCRALQTALHAPNRIVFCKVFITLQDSKKAGVTFDDCMKQDPAPVADVVPPPAPVQPQVIVVPVQQQAPVQTPVVAVTPTDPPVVEEIIPLGICTFASKTQCTAAGSDAAIVDPARPTSVCKEMLTAAREALARHPGYVIVLRGNRNPSEDKLLATTRANNVKKQLEAEGIKSGQIKTEAGIGTSRTVQITLEPVVN